MMQWNAIRRVFTQSSLQGSPPGPHHGHSAPVRPDPFTEQLIGAALEVRAAQPDTGGPRRRTAEPLTAAELRVLKLLPTSTYPQIAAALFISRSTVKTHLQSVYHKARGGVACGGRRAGNRPAPALRPPVAPRWPRAIPPDGMKTAKSSHGG